MQEDEDGEEGGWFEVFWDALRMHGLVIWGGYWESLVVEEVVFGDYGEVVEFRKEVILK